MKKYFTTILVSVSVILLLVFVLFVINQTVQVVDLASRVDPRLGTVVLILLLSVYLAGAVGPLVIFLRLPAPLRPPNTETSPDFPRYMEGLKRRLGSNRRLSGRSLENRQDIEAALAFLGAEADTLIKATASRVFITTGVSQSGRLDALLVLSAVSQMLWQIAYLFYQRPTPRDFVYLYANVGATVFFASELQDIDVHEQVEPILAATFGSAISTLPGTSLLINSMLTASGNAFLTLRVGAIAKRYCGSLCLDDRRSLRRAATSEAIRMFGGIVGQCTATISRAAWAVSKRKVGNTLSQTGERIKRTARGFFSQPLPKQEMAASEQKEASNPRD